MSISAEEVAAILAALQILKDEHPLPSPDRWVLAARLGDAPDPWLSLSGEAYPKLYA